ERQRPQAESVELGECLRQGLQQAQSLLVLDLEKCTRCDEWTKACSDAHGGVTRLIREGLRFDKFLVASSCRSCLDPYCMVGCPVDSIHRRNSREIVIEDWCIGCGNCAKQCPYGSIQMHDIGVIPEKAIGWRYLPAALVGDAPWQRVGYRDREWVAGRAPFCWDRDFRESLGAANDGPTEASAAPSPILFRLEFSLTRDRLGPERQFRFNVTSNDPSLALW